MSKDSFNWLDVTAEAYDQADSESHALLYKYCLWQRRLWSGALIWAVHELRRFYLTGNVYVSKK